MSDEKTMPEVSTLMEDVYVNEDPENDSEFLYFMLKDSVHMFRIGLKDVIQMLAVAEHEGYVPSLPKDWFSAVNTRYNGAIQHGGLLDSEEV